MAQRAADILIGVPSRRSASTDDISVAVVVQALRELYTSVSSIRETDGGSRRVANGALL
jgi:hypothetical protein